MPFEHLVPLRFEDWGFFDRQRSVFSSMFKDMGDEWKEFDKDLEKIRSEMFQLKPIDFGSDFGSGFGSDFGKDFGKGFGDLGDFGSSSSRVTSKSTTTTTTKTSSTSSGASPESSLMLKVDRPIVQDSQGNKRLSLRFDCQQFKPEEISVKTIDNRLVVQAKHSEESPGRKVYREFSRQYILPEKIDPLTLNSTLTSDGVLSIEGPAPAGIDAPRERILPIRMLTQ